MMQRGVALPSTEGYGRLRARRVMAMARPSRGSGEVDAIRTALAAMPAQLSARAKAGHLAKAVARAVIQDSENSAVQRALMQVEQSVCPSPVLALAMDPAANFIQLVAAQRIERFRNRECRQLSAREWADETREIEKMLQVRLAEKFRRSPK